MTRSTVFAFVAATCSLLGGAEVDDDTARAERSLKLAQVEAETYKLTLEAAQGDKLKLVPQPVLRWTNPVSGQLYGGVYIWTHEGRPEAIASIYKWFSPHQHMSVEFHSLALGKLVVSRDDQPVWFPEAAGVRPQTIEGAPPPAAQALQRARQMRSLAQRFAAESGSREDSQVRERLRLLTKPIYRYQDTRGELLDGALFAFVQGNNPEVILLLEARRTRNRHEWQYALARQNSVYLQASLDGKTVWEVPRLAPPWNNVRNPVKPYVLFRREPELLPGTGGQALR